MKKEVVARLNKNFEEAAHIEQNIEYWMARDIQELLEYNDWRNFLNVIKKAKVACEKSGQQIQNHFGDVTKMVQVGSGVEREIPDIMLSRYACYLIAQNGDPRQYQSDFSRRMQTSLPWTMFAEAFGNKA